MCIRDLFICLAVENTYIGAQSYFYQLVSPPSLKGRDMIKSLEWAMTEYIIEKLSM